MSAKSAWPGSARERGLHRKSLIATTDASGIALQRRFRKYSREKSRASGSCSNFMFRVAAPLGS
jgi:hypothetical protein